MNSKQKQTQPQNPTATSLAPARTARDARADGGQEVAEPLASGAPPSNTAPDNCNDGYFKALRWGVDSLYLSYPGELSRESDARLKALKELAQSSAPGEVAKAQLPLGGHIFEVKEKGGPLAKRFSPSRSPNDDKLFQIAYSAILSYMAKHGFPASELYEGAEDFLANAYAYHEKKANDLGLPFDDFIAERLALKHRQYNTAINDPQQEAKRQAKELAEQAKAYRKEADGN